MYTQNENIYKEKSFLDSTLNFYQILELLEP